METGRYNRQKLIEGWKQEELEKARAVIIGSGNLANFTAASLVALGIGNIEIYDSSEIDGNSKEFLSYQAREGESKVQALEEKLKQINPLSRIKGINISLENGSLISIIGKPGVIIDLTNSQDSKTSVLKYAQRKNIPVVSASSDNIRGEMYVIMDKNKEIFEKSKLRDYKGKCQGSVPSEILGGLITEETRKILMPLNEEKPVRNLAYSLASPRRFSRDLEEEIKDVNLKNKKVLVVGAGALGNFVSLGVALSGVGDIDILDFDEVDPTNLNRQILFYDAIGKNKAEALASRILEIVPKLKIKGLTEKLDENSDYFKENKPDLIMDCVDSLAVRAIINYFGVRYKIPIVSGGTNPNSGQVVVYEPGESYCLDCSLGVEKALGKTRTSSSCRYAPDPSVIMSNEVIGGIMVGEARKVLDRDYGEPIRKILKYDSLAKLRGGLVGIDGRCDCKKPDAKTWMNEVIKKYGVKNSKKI
jgi:molybdopterin/thiamine biosynthesis adenylyltransferase